MTTATHTPADAARVPDAVKVYGRGDTEVRALDGVSVDFPAGRFTVVVGPSGSGSPPSCTASPGSTPSPPTPRSSATPTSPRSTTAA
ncbi:hypothetical protein ACFWVF_01320 [Streptomyces sp. NPDC058659]|uniref:hypothetical protein n=1 Tax=unclassified Streptomyces TaxID=2593676 RepID=UPI00365316C5